MTKLSKKRAVVYARYSSSQQHESSIERQNELADQWAKVNDVEIVKKFSDLAVTSKDGSNLDKELGKCIDFIKKDGNVTFLVVEDADRLSRENPLTFVTKFSDLLNSGVQIVQSNSGMITTPKQGMSFLGLLMKQFLASEENEKKRQRVTESYERRFKQKVACPKIPFGYQRLEDGSVDEHAEAADVVRRVFKHYTHDGWTYNRIAKEFNRAKIINPHLVHEKKKSAKFKQGWTAAAVRRTIMSESYYSGNQKTSRGVMHGVFKPLIDKETWEKAQYRALVVRQKRDYTERMNMGKISNLFSDLLICSDCGSKFHIVCSKNRSYRLYGCSGKQVSKCDNSFRCFVGKFESAILSRLLEFLDTGEFGKLISRIEKQNKEALQDLESEKKRTEKDLAQERKLLDGLVDKYALASKAVAKTLEKSIVAKQEIIKSMEDRLVEVEAEIMAIQSMREKSVLEISKDIDSLKDIIRSGGSEFAVEYDEGEVLDEQEVENVMQQLPDLYINVRTRLKSIVATLVEKIEINHEGLANIHLKTDRIDTIPLIGIHCGSVS